MGKSKTIKDHEEKNKEFQEYIKKIKEDIQTKAVKEVAEFAEKIKAFYGNNSHVIVQEGERWDFRQKSEFNLDSIGKAIEGIVDSTFAIMEEKKEGMEKDYKVLALEMGKNIVLHALKIFETSSVIEYSHSYTAETIAPGLTMHMLVVTDSYTNDKYFDKESIIENYIIFKVIYSEELSQAEAKMAVYDKQIKLLNGYMNNLAAAEETFMKRLVSEKGVEEKELLLHSQIVGYMRASMEYCMTLLGISHPVKAKPRTATSTKIQRLLTDNTYSENGKKALRKLLRA